MLRDQKTRRPALFAVFAAVAVGTVGCSHVGQDEFDTTVAQVRREVRDGDEALSRSMGARIDDVDGRVSGVEGRMAGLDRDVQALSADFDVMVERMEMAMRVNTPIFFDFDDTELRAHDQELLDRFSSIVQDYYPSSIITVEGFTDSAGDADYNLALGQRRAEAVKDYLVTYGAIGMDQIRTVSYGEDHARLINPQDVGPGDDGWQNRRVVLVIDHGDRYSSQVAQSPQP